MGIKIEMTESELHATYLVLKAAELKAYATWMEKETVANRLKYEKLEAARLRIAQVLPA